MTDVVKPVATWRKVLAAILDFLTVFSWEAMRSVI